MIFTYGSLSTTLRNPELRDSEGITLAILVHRSRNQQLHLFRPANRYDRITWSMVSTTNKKAAIDNFLAICTAAQGMEITLEWGAYYYSCFINQESVEITTKQDNCSYDLSLTLVITNVVEI